MSSRHHSSSSTRQQQKYSTNLIESLSDQLDYLHVSTTTPTTTQDAQDTLNTSNYGQLDVGTKRPAWLSNSNGNRREESPPKSPTKTKSPQQQPPATSSTTTLTSTTNALPTGPQPLLQLMPHTPPHQGSMSPTVGAGLLSPDAQAFYYMNQGYYAATQAYGYSNQDLRDGATYPYQQYPAYMPPNQYQWPMTNINFMPNLFVMAGAGPSHNPNYALPPPSFPPMPLMKQQPFRNNGGGYDSNRRFQNNRMHGDSGRNGRNTGSLSSQSSLNRQPNNHHRRQGSKTALCRNITSLQQCSYGERCYFAHSADELKPKPANTKYKTVNCTAFAEKGSCPYADKCHYIHPGEGEGEDRPPTDPLRR